MSKTIVVAVRDAAMSAFARPVFVPSVGVAIRSFTDEINRKEPDNQMAAHPEDYELHLLAEFDDETGSFLIPERGKCMLVRGKEVAKE